jgi:hypothetical protein
MSERRPEITIFSTDGPTNLPSGLSAESDEPSSVSEDDRDFDADDIARPYEPTEIEDFPRDSDDRNFGAGSAEERPYRKPPGLDSIRVTKTEFLPPGRSSPGSQSAFVTFEIILRIGSWLDKDGRRVGGFGWPAIFEVGFDGPIVDGPNHATITPSTFESDLREMVTWVMAHIYAPVSQGQFLPPEEQIDEFIELLKAYQQRADIPTRVTRYRASPPVIYLLPQTPTE